MAARKRETVTVVSQEQLADGIFSMWIQTEAAKTARPGQFISMYTNDGSKLLPRPISICEIDTETSKLRVVYRVTAEKTGTEQFSKMKAGDTLPIREWFSVRSRKRETSIFDRWRYWSSADFGACKTA